MAVMVGVDPHQGSHTAVAIDRDEMELASVTVRPTRRQVDELLVWAARFEARIWAIESAGGQFVAAGRARVGSLEQERCERRQVGRDRGVARTASGVGGSR